MTEFEAAVHLQTLLCLCWHNVKAKEDEMVDELVEVFAQRLLVAAETGKRGDVCRL